MNRVQRRSDLPSHRHTAYKLKVGVAGRSVRSFCINGHHLGPKTWPLYGVERWPQIRGFLSTITGQCMAMQSGPR